jgi:hypothetical protein
VIFTIADVIISIAIVNGHRSPRFPPLDGIIDLARAWP